MQRAEEDVSTQRSLNSTRYFKGPCSICNWRGHKVANCYKNPNREKFQRVEDQKERHQNMLLLAAITANEVRKVVRWLRSNNTYNK
jgi:hypothetical protein